MVSNCVEINQCVDGVEDDATIHPGKLAPALSLATSKRVHWFPKLTCSVGDRAWASVHKSKFTRRVSATAEFIGCTRLIV